MSRHASASAQNASASSTDGGNTVPGPALIRYGLGDAGPASVDDDGPASGPPASTLDTGAIATARPSEAPTKHAATAIVPRARLMCSPSRMFDPREGYPIQPSVRSFRDDQSSRVIAKTR